MQPPPPHSERRLRQNSLPLFGVVIYQLFERWEWMSQEDFGPHRGGGAILSGQQHVLFQNVLSTFCGVLAFS